MKSIVEMAIEAGFDTGKMIVHDYEVDWVWPKDHPRKSCITQLEAFAKLVAAAERQACLDICDAEAEEWQSPKYHYAMAAAVHCARKIKDRNQELYLSP